MSLIEIALPSGINKIGAVTRSLLKSLPAFAFIQVSPMIGV